MAQISQQINELIKQRNDLADNISAKGISATKTEKYNTLIDKVNDIAAVNGEEIVLENTAKYNDIPSSVVSVEYPEQKNLFDVNQDTDIIYGATKTVLNDKIVFKTTNDTNYSFFKYKIPTTIGETYTVSVKEIYWTNTDIDGLWIHDEDFMDAHKYGVITPTNKSVIFIADSEYVYIQQYITINSETNQTLEITGLQLEKGSTATAYEPFKTYDIGVQLQSKNLIPYPYDISATTEKNGLSITVNNDGTITVNGTATADTYVRLYDASSRITLAPGTYTLSSGESGGAFQKYMLYFTGDIDVYCNPGPKTFTITEQKKIFIVIAVYKGITVDNVVFKPQLELGSTTTSYTPYISDFSTVNVTACGKNLFDINGVTGFRTGQGIPVASSQVENNTIYARVGAYGNNIFTLNSYYLPAGKYTVSFKCLNTTSGDLGNDLIRFSFKDFEQKTETTTKIIRSVANETVPMKGTLTIPTNGNYHLQLQGTGNASNYDKLQIRFSEIQIEYADEATSYTSYQSGATYPSNANGIVPNVKSIYPITTLICDSGATMTITSGTYKQITPTNGNAFTKAYQPTVDSSIDNNIKPEYIRAGVTILGVTGTYEGE